MLPRAAMLAIKNRAGSEIVIFLAFTVFLVGCTPAGPRALLEGKRLIADGQYSQAVERLKIATSLLATNAQAWNYLGVAYHRTGQPTNAEAAYRKALALNRDLVEAHFNLGCLCLEQNKLDAARAELTTYTMRQPKSVDGWLKLGTVQLRTHELAVAEKTFNYALYLDSKNGEAMNDLGVIQLQRNRPYEAATWFAAALKQQPKFPPALLNLATVSQRHLNDRATALQRYREYLALTPRQPNWDAVNGIVQGLESQMPMTRQAITNAMTQTVTNANATKTQITSASRTPAGQGQLPATVTKTSLSPALSAATNVEVVKLPPPPTIKSSPDIVTSTAPVLSTHMETATTTPAPAAVAEVPKPAKKSFLQRLNPLNLFRSAPNPPPKITPLPPATPTTADVSRSTVSTATAPVVDKTSVSPATRSFPRYSYISPVKPIAGDRDKAARAFAQGSQAQQASRLTEAAQSYRQATQVDPSYFEAYYNLGFVSFHLRNYSQALEAYEYSLAIRPESPDARYNFALVLKAAGYPLDSAEELERILAANPNETRAHLALGNLYAQQLADLSKARAHYLKVLELEPRHPQASDIRFWLAANPP